MDQPGLAIADELLTSGELLRIMPGAPQKTLSAFLIEFNKQFPRYNITTPLRMAAFIAQGAVETAGLRSLVESLNYSAPQIVKVWPGRFHSIEAATPYANNQEKLGNNVYAGRMGNGPEESGDGFNYRGRGWFCGTGKDFYKRMAQLTGVDFVGNPNLLTVPRFAVQSAVQFWKSNNLNVAADNGDLKHITKVINGGLTGMDQRTAYYNKAKLAFGVK